MRPWLKQGRETQAAYEAFLVYRDMDQRSLARVADVTGVGDSVVMGWSARFSWVDRALEWDRHQQQILDGERERVLKERAQRNLKVGDAFVRFGVDQVQRLARLAQKRPDDEAVITTREALLLVKEGSALEAEVLGAGGREGGGDPEVERLIDRALEELDRELPNPDGAHEPVTIDVDPEQ